MRSNGSGSRIATGLVTAVLGVSGWAAPAQSQFEGVGSVSFPASTSPEAHQHFLRGVSILHSFGWKQARAEFHAAQAIDPDFALAYWGESLAYNHPLFSGMDTTDPRAALERLGATPEERLAKAPTAREKGFLRAVEVLWGEGDQQERRVGYMEAMGELYEAYPDDSEVAAFHALALLGATQATGDLSGRWNVQAGAIALRLLNRYPDHPGAAHYAIHAFDEPLLAPLALDAAHVFAGIAPAVAHARHMPSHIFIQHGMWEGVSQNNQSAYDVAVELWEPGDPLGDAVHPLDWGHYGDLQRGDYEKARIWMDRLAAMVENEGFGGGAASGVERAARAIPLLAARYTVETEEWSISPVTEDASSQQVLATALSAWHMGNRGEVIDETVEEMGRRSNGTGYDHVIHSQVMAIAAANAGMPGTAVRHMDEAQEAVEAMAPPRGSANPVKPVHELYGEILLALRRPAEAAEKFEISLLRMPGRPRSLLGLARAHAGAHDRAAAAEAYGRLADLWAGTGLPELGEAEAFLADDQEQTDSENRR